MQTDSSASFTYFASVSASECTTTVRMPISRQARWMRSAISPRLAIRTFSNIERLLDDHEDFAELDRLAVGDQDVLHGAGDRRLDRVHHLHRFDDEDGLALVHAVARLHEGRGPWLGREIRRAD